MLNAGSGGTTDTDDDGGGFGDGPVVNVPDTTTVDDDPWESTRTTGSTDYTGDVESTDTSDDSDSTDGTIEYTGGVDTGLTRATGDGGGGDVAANDPVNPSASPDTTDREAMTAEADEQQELIDTVRDDPDNDDVAEAMSDAEDRLSQLVEWAENNPKKVGIGVLGVGALAMGGEA